MNEYNYIDPSGKTVICIASIITAVLLILALSIITVIDKVWLHFISSKVMFWLWTINIIIAFIVIIIGGMIRPIYKYKIFRYKLENQEITVRNGLWFINVVKIPLFRIQNVDTHEGILMRKYNLASLTLSTAGGNTEIKLIDKNKANTLKQEIKKGNHSMPQNL